MKTVTLIAAGLLLATFANAAERLTIAPARSFPGFQKLPLATTPNTGPHLHPIFDIGDVNKDGRLDIIMFEMDGSDSAPPGSVHSVAAVYLQTLDHSFTRQSATYMLPIANVVRDFLLADFNEDGNLDLLLNDYSVDLILLRGNGDGTFQSPTNLGLNALAFPTVADLNRDGHLDIVAATRERAAMVFLGAGNGSFNPGVTLDTLTNPSGERRGQIMIGDINRDGNLDVAVASILDFTTTWTGNLDVFIGHGDGTFDNPIRNANVGTWRGALGDFNGDGILDYAGDRYSPEAVEIWIGQGDGHFTKKTSYSLSGLWPNFITFGDLNGDNLLDMIVSNTKFATGAERPASLAIFLGKGDGTFQSRLLHDPLPGTGQSSFAPKLVDLDGDSALDIVTVAITSDWITNTFVMNRNQGSNPDTALGFHVTVENATNRPLILETSTNLQTWIPIATNTPVADWSLVESLSGSSRKFYRTRKQ